MRGWVKLVMIKGCGSSNVKLNASAQTYEELEYSAFINEISQREYQKPVSIRMIGNRLLFIDPCYLFYRYISRSCLEIHIKGAIPCLSLCFSVTSLGIIQRNTNRSSATTRLQKPVYVGVLVFQI